jgi:hypothetical protein
LQEEKRNEARNYFRNGNQETGIHRYYHKRREVDERMINEDYLEKYCIEQIVKASNETRNKTYLRYRGRLEAFIEILDIINKEIIDKDKQTHCESCGEWLDDQDTCPECGRIRNESLL